MVSDDKAPNPGRLEAEAPSNHAERVVEVLTGAEGSPDHPDIGLTRLLGSLEGADNAAILSALEDLAEHEDPH